MTIKKKYEVHADNAIGPFKCDAGDAQTNLLLNLSKDALDKLDSIGYGIVNKYRLAGYSDSRVRMIALSHLLDGAV